MVHRPGKSYMNLFTHVDGWKCGEGQAGLTLGTAENCFNTYSTLFHEVFTARSEALGVPMKFPLKSDKETEAEARAAEAETLDRVGEFEWAFGC